MILSKFQYIRGLQCPKSLWLYKHKPELRSITDTSQESLFEAGVQVGDPAPRYCRISSAKYLLDDPQGTIGGRAYALHCGTKVPPPAYGSRVLFDCQLSYYKLLAT